MIIIGDLAQPLAATAFGADSVWGSRTFIIYALSMLVTLPLAFFPGIHHLRGSSLLAVLTVIGVSGVVVVYGAHALMSGRAWLPSDSSKCNSSGPGHADVFVLKPSILSCLPIIVFSLGNHMQVSALRPR
jgi:amino acid permease